LPYIYGFIAPDRRWHIVCFSIPIASIFERQRGLAMVETAKPLMALCASDIMSRNVVMIPREMSLQGAARMLARAAVSGAPVVDENGRCIGVLSATDFMNWVKDDHKSAIVHEAEADLCKPWQILDAAIEMTGCVESCMTKDPVLAFANIKIGELAAMMMEAHIHRIIVVDSISQRPIGVVSSTDILAAFARAHRMAADQEQSEADPTQYDFYGDTMQ
jgi:predicted transcriptional regulator